jgi:hypothetical protein
MDVNNAAGEDIRKLVSGSGSMRDIDKLKVHFKEVESITNLSLVLTERLDRLDEELKQISANDAKVTVR